MTGRDVEVRTDAGDPAGSTLRELPPRQRLLLVVVLVVSCAPYVVGAVAARVDGWASVGDDGLILTGTQEMLSRHLPLTGETTSSGKFGVPSNHPAPVAFEVQAPFVWLLGARSGQLASAAAVAVASVLGIGYLALRAGGLRRALWALSVTSAMAASIGGAAYLYRPFKTVVAVLPLMALLVASWALLRGVAAALPVMVAAASYTAGSSAQYVVFVAAVVGATVVLAVHERVRTGGARGRPAWWSPAPLAASVAILLVVWAPPAWEAATADGGNLRQLVRAARAATGERRGLGPALQDAGAAAVLRPEITRTQQAAAPLWTSVVAALLGACAVAGLAVTWRRTPRADRQLVVLAAAGVLGAVVSVSTLPADEGYAFFRLLSTSVALGFVWFAVPLALAPSGASLLPASLRRRRTQLAVGAFAATALALRVLWPMPLQADQDYVPFTMRATPELADEVAAALPVGDGIWAVVPIGPRSMKFIVHGLDAALEADGFHTNQHRPPALVPRPARDPAGTLLVVPAVLPDPVGGWTLVASYRPDGWDAAAAERSARAALDEARRSGVALGPVAAAALGSVLCPGTSGPCPAAEAALAAPDPLGAVPAWFVAMLYVEQFDEQLPFDVMEGPEPGWALLEQLRASWVDQPVEVWMQVAG